LEPSREPITGSAASRLYYAGEFEQRREQFELHKTVNREDVKTPSGIISASARTAGIEKARGAALIPIKGDARIPMMQVHALYAGKGTAEDVMSAATAGNPPAGELRQRMFTPISISAYSTKPRQNRRRPRPLDASRRKIRRRRLHGRRRRGPRPLLRKPSPAK